MKPTNRLYMDTGSTLIFRLCVLLGILFLALYTILCTISSVPHDVVGLIFLLLYIAAALFAFFRREQTKSRKNIMISIFHFIK